MKLSDLDQRFVDRLTNWGRWCLSEQKGSSGSWLYDLCLRMAIEKGKTITDAWRELKPRTLNVQDAEFIERVFAASSLSRVDRELVAAYFVWCQDPRKTCRILGISRRAWESLLCMAVVSLQEAVDTTETSV